MNGSVVVVDASLAVKWLVNEEGTEKAVALLERWADRQTVIAAPPLLPVEITNVLYKRVRRAEITVSDAVILLRQLLGLGIALRSTELLHQSALEWAGRLGLPAAYDSYYLALADYLGCEFWTADERLYNTAKERLTWIRYYLNPTQ
jgi:predicted nucleic acid-binding protein